MKRALTAQQMRAVDAASERFGMPAAILMENAGRALAETAVALAGPRGRFLVLCGLGNNGGDGLVAGRWLSRKGRRVDVELVGEASALTGDPARNHLALRALEVAIAPIADAVTVGEGDVVIDALLGTGLSRAPEGRYAEAIERIARWRAQGARVLSADLPSGLESDSGRARSPCVTADATATFGFLKVGQLSAEGAARCGVIEVIDIGIPPVALEVAAGPSAHLVEERDARRCVSERGLDTHKGSFGHVLIVAGSQGKTGAAALVGLGALRAGAGLVTIASRPESLGAILGHGPELMGVELSLGGALEPSDLPALLRAAEGKDAVVLGPGIARGDQTKALIAALVQELALPLVLDADGLNALDGHPEVLRGARARVLLTPHPGEMSRLLLRPTSEIQADRISAARELATRSSAVVALKGARTVVARPDDGAVFVNPTGNPGMATGGTGDVLAGLCGALLAQGLSPTDAAVAGVYVHGLAGDLAAKRTGEMGLVASDLLAGLQEVWCAWSR